jgi:ubiquinone/menaquinone biosynthesis C-methylase UbiE
MIGERTLALLRDPETREPLELRADCLVDAKSGAQYPIREGIPVFLSTASGQNRKYQELYDRIAALYDPALAIGRWIRFNKDLRLEFVRELEIPENARVLEVSVGTGANLKYFPPDADLFGLDLSWGMLRQCRKNLRRWKRTAALFHGEAERLPFAGASFDVVFHVGGINFFNDKARAIGEMIRVARPGTRIVIVDETEKLVRRSYEKLPILRRYFRNRKDPVADLSALVPAEMTEIRCREIVWGTLYCLTFRTPRIS